MRSNSTKILILMIALNLAALSGYYLSFQYVKKQTKAMSSLMSTINLGEQKNSHIGSLRSVVKDTEEKRQRLDSFLLTSETEIPFIERVESLAKSSGLNVKTNSVSSVADAFGSTKTFQMQVETDGSWSNTLYYLSQMENLPYHIVLRGVYLGKQPVVSGNEKKLTFGRSWNARFDISVTEKK